MESKIVDLRKLYTYAKHNPSGEALHGKSQAGREYGQLVKRLTEEIADKRGFYLWGKYDKNSLWRNVYLGKAGYSKTANLRARIAEELKDEKWFLWVSLLNKLEMSSLGAQYYPKQWKKYEKGLERTLKKAGSTYIIWVATPALNEQHFTKIEAELIETLNPIANMQRPAPTLDLQIETVEIIRQFRKQIQKSRP